MSPNLATIRSSNAALVGGLKGAPVAVFVGGTSGIGQGLAEAFARWRNGNAHIIIVGRNQKAAQAVFDRFPKPTSDEEPSAAGSTWSHEFVQCDATLMKNVRTAAQEILEKHSKINYLLLSPGYFTTGGRDETEEGIDKKLALHYYARWKFIDDLLPALRKASEEGEDARVLSVLGAARGGAIDVEDLGLKKGFSLTAAAEATATYNDLMMEAFHEKNPGITFSHSSPGMVLTNIMGSARTPWMRAVGPVFKVLAKPFLTSPEQCAEYQWYGLLNHTDGAFRIGEKGEDLGKKNYFGDGEQRKKLWEHTVEETGV